MINGYSLCTDGYLRLPYQRPYNHGHTPSYSPMSNPSNGQNGIEIFEVEHVKTFTISPTSSLPKSSEVVGLLKKQPKGERIRVRMLIEGCGTQGYLVITEGNQELERFPLWALRSLSFKTDSEQSENNNLILFQIDANSLSNDEPSQDELHVFQILNAPAQVLFESIKNARKTDRNLSNTPIPVAPLAKESSQPKPSVSGSEQGYSRDNPPLNLKNLSASSNKTLTATPSDEVDIDQLRAEVRLLNHLFDDIEDALQEMRVRPLKLVRRASAVLSKTGTSSKQKEHSLSKAKVQANAKHYDPKFRATIEDFYQKVKLSAIILSRITDHVEEPNAPQIARQLFLILKEALSLCRDPKTGQVAVAREALRPRFPQETLTFLEEHLQVDQFAMMTELGTAWTKSREECGDSLVFIPQFRHKFELQLDEYEPSLFRFQEKQPLVDPKKRYRRPAPLNAFIKDLMARRVNIVKVIVNFRARNERELSVEAGEYLELINSSGEWYEVRNCDGKSGFCPSVVVRVIEHQDSINSPTASISKKSSAGDQ